MQSAGKWLCHSLFALAVLQTASSVELTFELLDNAKDCFFEHIVKNTTCNLEFQVVTGGSYDVDVTLLSPSKIPIFRVTKSQFDSKRFVTEEEGEYAVCFSNEFSTFSHKLVYMDFQVGEEAPLPGMGHSTVMTQMEASAEGVHKSLVTIADFQTHHRLREAQGRKRAEDLNERVFMWSLIETICVLTVGIGQVFVLKNFFSDRKPQQYQRLG